MFASASTTLSSFGLFLHGLIHTLIVKILHSFSELWVDGALHNDLCCAMLYNLKGLSHWTLFLWYESKWWFYQTLMDLHTSSVITNMHSTTKSMQARYMCVCVCVYILFYLELLCVADWTHLCLCASHEGGFLLFANGLFEETADCKPFICRSDCTHAAQLHCTLTV